MIKFSIIIASFNSAKTLEKTLLSIINQTYLYKEIIIVDGASNDSTPIIINKYLKWIKYYISEKDSGIYDAWNKGLKRVEGNWVCFIGSDDFFFNKFVLEDFQKKITLIDQSKYKLVYANLNVYDNKDNLLETIGMPWDIARKRLEKTMSLPHVGLMHHFSLFEELGYFNINFKIAGDYDFILRIIKKYEAIYLPDIVVAGMLIGGISSNKLFYKKMLSEEFQARLNNNVFPINSIWLKRYFYIFIRNLILCFFGEKFLFRLRGLFLR